MSEISPEHGRFVPFLVRTVSAIFILLLISTAMGQENSPATAPAEPSPTEIVQLLGKTIDWYRQTQQEQHIATEPGDLGFMADNRRMADQIVKLAFDFARQEEQQLAKQPKVAATNPGDAGSRYESLSRTSAQADAMVQQTQTELQSMKESLEKAPANKKKQIESQVEELQSELALFQARQQALHSMLDFAGGASKGAGTSLRAQIEELARAVPSAISGSSPNESVPPSDTRATTKMNEAVANSTTTGMWALATDLFRLSNKRSLLSSNLHATRDLEQISSQFRAPLITHLKQLIQAGDQLTKQADTSDQSGLVQEKQQLDQLTIEFKQVSGLLSSLGKQAILLDLYKRSLANWQGEVASELKERLKGLLLRIFGLAIALGAVLLIGEFWRRAILRYVHDARRRYQFMLMRKIALWCGFAIVLLFAFVTELGAVATFAGLITAGVAVALQNVLVSIVGYFFLIGKYGIRVGDRVQIGSVTGEVVDIGLVRFHLMELSGGVADSEPTGRIVAFSNSVVFQSTAGLFKQIPGTNFVWREVTLRFASDSDYRQIRERLQKAIDSAFADYKDLFEGQRRQMELSVSSVPTSELRPRAHARFTTSATEVVIRYPVIADKFADIDERIMSEIFAAVAHEPKLKLLDSAISTLKVEG
ncbi:MAG TPA: mechanosensitive ion channel domain-containing protein [Terriglobales bacterium]|nr:mechanosensitive ion channel domain-containing protein [Terriglobales bacterium]